MPLYFSGSEFHLNESVSPYKRSYNDKRKAVFERDPKYCENVSFGLKFLNKFLYNNYFSSNFRISAEKAGFIQEWKTFTGYNGYECLRLSNWK